MKKSLLLSALALTGAGMAAALPTAPKTYPNQLISNISPDGRYVASDMYGAVVITDLDTGKEYSYADDGTGSDIYYGCGFGNCWSATGILVGNTSSEGDPAYWQNGEWKQLPNPENRSLWLHGINPDGTVICATSRVVKSDNAPEGMADVPVIWVLGEDGKWSNPIVLPYPEKDFTGRVPQMATAIRVSDDGKTIAGQILDYSGQFPMPVVYRCDADNNWNYYYVAPELCNPKHRVFPEYSDDAPVLAEMQNFISDPQKRAEWEAAYEAWVDSQFSLPYPDPVGYMSAEDIARYNEAVDKYNEEATKYNAQLEAFNEVFYYMYEETAMYIFNNVLMNGDAGIFATTLKREEIENPEDPFSNILTYTTPLVVNLTTGEINRYPVEGYDAIRVSAIAADGSLLGYSDEVNRHGFIKQNGKDWQPLYDFLKENAEPEYEKWLKDNICHTFDSMDYITGESYSYVNEPLIGISSCTPDLKVIAASAENTWDFNDMSEYYSYVIPTPKATVGLSKVVNDADFQLTAQKGGIISVSAEADIFVYNMQGVKLFECHGANGSVATGLSSGLYIIKANANGSSHVLKATF